MPNLPIRNLGQIGVVTDNHPYDLPINGVSRANNVRFYGGAICRANVFRSVLNTTLSTPVFTFSIKSSSDYDKIGIADKNGSIYTYLNGTEDDVTPSTWSSSNSDSPYTSAYLQNVVYINRDDHVPWYYKPTSTDFAALPNWTSTHRCEAFRSYRDYLIALNITKGTTTYPTMVKWSDIAQANDYPASWDETDSTKSAGENILGDMKTPIVDGLPLRDAFVVYSQDQVWMMQETGGPEVFNFRKLFDNKGMISQNCAVEVEGKHFVFGRNDIYVHDGSSIQSIIEGKNRKLVFGNLNYKRTYRCFVTHNAAFHEVIFAYVSGDDDVGFVGTEYANRGAVYNYVSNTWSFIDLPNVGMMTSATYASTRTYTNISSTWTDVGGTWYNQDAAGRDVLFAVSPASSGVGLTASRLYGYETSSNGVVPYAISSEATKQILVERIGVDLDEIQAGLNQYKVFRSIYPQVDTENNDQTLTFSFAGGSTPQASMSFTSSGNFTPITGYKVDTREGGRYLAWRMTSTDYADFQLSGFDIDVIATGRR
jgi:hypothetical protein